LNIRLLKCLEVVHNRLGLQRIILLWEFYLLVCWIENEAFSCSVLELDELVQRMRLLWSWFRLHILQIPSIVSYFDSSSGPVWAVESPLLGRWSHFVVIVRAVKGALVIENVGLACFSLVRTLQGANVLFLSLLGSLAENSNILERWDIGFVLSLSITLECGVDVPWLHEFGHLGRPCLWPRLVELALIVSIFIVLIGLELLDALEILVI